MKDLLNYKEVIETIIKETSRYVVDNDIKAMVLGISGGIDSTVVAAICYEVSLITGIPLIGRSLPTKFNKDGETSAATLVGEAFCNDFKEVHIQDIYANIVDYINDVEADYGQTKLANGNIQARIRMLYLYNLAGVHQGMVMDTDNLTENNLGYFTIHGDVGDYNPIGGLWKTEIFELAEVLLEHYSVHSHCFETCDIRKNTNSDYARCKAISQSLALKPTAGLGISDSDLDELGADSYEQVDTILQEIVRLVSIEDKNPSSPEERLEDFMKRQTLDIPTNIVENVAKRHFKSSFKRKKLPIKISRALFV
jgi:NAD+ synthetase